jgi:preprotein translocase subunit SecE
MSNNSLQKTSQFGEKLKLILVALSIFIGIVGSYFFSEQPSLVRLAVFLASLTAAILIFSTSSRSQKLLLFIKEAVRETEKVIWPTRKEAAQITAIVFVFVFLLAIFLWGIDKLLEILLYYLILGWKQ